MPQYGFDIKKSTVVPILALVQVSEPILAIGIAVYDNLKLGKNFLYSI